MIKHLCWSSLWTFYIYLFSSISLSYQEILSVGNNSLSPSSSSTYHDLLETYFQEEYLSNLQDLLDNCHHHYSRTHNQLTTPPTIHINKKNCQYFEYFYYLLNEVNQQNKQQQHTISNEIYHQYQLQKIDTSHSYETIFENFILKGRSYKGSLPSMQSSDLRQCNSREYHHLSSDYPLIFCNSTPDTFSSLEIPSIAYNSYNPRLPRRHQTIDEPELLDLSSHWPTITRISNLTNHNHTLYCPYNMHMILWGPKEPLSVKILNISQLTNGYTAQLGQDIIHYLRYNMTYSDINTTWISYDSTILSLGEYLFVPFNSLAVFEQPDNNTDIYKLCFFDASNLNHVRTALTTESFIAPSSRSLLKLLSTPSQFESTMTRSPPSTLSYPNYLLHPKPTGSNDEIASSDKSKNNRRNRGKNDFKEWQDVARWNQMIASYVIPQTAVPEIVSIHRRNVTLSWEAVYYPSGQDQTKYGVNITICLADTVLQSQYQGLLSLTSAVDDNKVPGCRVVTKEKKDLITTNFNEDTDTRVLLTHIRDLQPSMNYKFRLTTFYGESGSLPSKFTTTFSTLPDIPPSPPLPPFTVTPNLEMATSVHITFQRPKDDGGQDILGYHVFTSNPHRNHHKLWVWNGMYSDTSIGSTSTGNFDVIHLLPKTQYQFAIMCFSRIGNSTLVTIPTIVTTGDKGNGVLAGHNHHTRFQSQSFHHAHRKDPSILSSQPSPIFESDLHHSLVTLNDAEQLLTYYNAETKQSYHFEVWDCHWSPRLFLVKGEAVWAIPPLADRAITSSISSSTSSQEYHASHMAGKIAIVQRGQVPVFTKALNVQRAGAIACIILDHGVCHEFDQTCMPGSDKKKGDRFAVFDDADEWAQIKIPIVLMKSSDANQFLSYANLHSFDEIRRFADSNSGKSSHSAEL